MKSNITPKLVISSLKWILYCWHSALGTPLTEMQPACNVHLQTVDFGQEFRKECFKIKAKQKCEEIQCQVALWSRFQCNVLLNVRATLNMSIIYIKTQASNNVSSPSLPTVGVLWKVYHSNKNTYSPTFFFIAHLGLQFFLLFPPQVLTKCQFETESVWNGAIFQIRLITIVEILTGLSKNTLLVIGAVLSV